MFRNIKQKIVAWILKDFLTNPSIDLYIRIVDYRYHKYEVATSNDYNIDRENVYALEFTYENWTGIVGDGKKHMHIEAYYRNHNGENLIKIGEEDFSNLLDRLIKWNNKHRIK